MILAAAAATATTSTMRRAIASSSSRASSSSSSSSSSPCFATSLPLSSSRLASSSPSGPAAVAEAFTLPRRRSSTTTGGQRRRMRSSSSGNEEDAGDDSDDVDSIEIPTAADDDATAYVPPWSLPHLRDRSSSSFARFRQHVNPLARRYRMSAELPDGWPTSVYDDPALPLFLDIGCGKGGFLLEMAGRGRGLPRRGGGDDDDDDEDEDEEDDATTPPLSSSSSSSHWPLPPALNYLGLEIRPGVSQYAQSRVSRRGLGGSVSFVGCNANVDLDRILTLYAGGGVVKGGGVGSTTTATTPVVPFVAIQFPDPHFKTAHAKRRVVTSELVATLAKFVAEGGGVFLQSDVRGALEAMREKFVEGGDGVGVGVGPRYFDEWTPPGHDGDAEEYGMENPLGVPTEREGSVLKNGLPVFRTLFRRNGVPFAAL